jgi:anti-anti-sigma factor
MGTIGRDHLYDTNITIDHEDGTCIVRVACDVDLANAQTIRRYVEEASGGAIATIVSLEACSYIDSTGLQALMQLASGRGVSFSVVVPRGTHTRKIFEITGLDSSLNVRDSIADARAPRHRGLQRKPALT